MSAAPKRNLPASVRQRLLTLSQQRKQPFDLVLVRYGIERLLYRLSRSPHAERLVLKGAMLFAVWSEAMHRPTRDVDFLGFGSADRDELKAVFVALCQLEVEPDGLRYLPESVRAESIRDEEAYPGTRITLEARLENIRIPVQADIGFGDAVTPAPEAIEFPTLLDFPAPHLRAYPIYTVIAEKLEAVVRLGEANSRMKDFFDLWYLSRNFPFDGGELVAALTRTFTRREMPLPAAVPTGLTAEFATLKVVPWSAFVRRNALGSVELSGVLQAVRTFALPPLRAAGLAAPLAVFAEKPSDGHFEHLGDRANLVIAQKSLAALDAGNRRTIHVEPAHRKSRGQVTLSYRRGRAFTGCPNSWSENVGPTGGRFLSLAGCHVDTASLLN